MDQNFKKWNRWKVSQIYSKLTSVIYWYFYKCYTEDSFVLYPWIKCVGDILYSCGLFYVWINQKFRTVNKLVSFIKENLKNQFVQDWNTVVNCSHNCVLIIEFSKQILASKIICYV